MTSLNLPEADAPAVGELCNFRDLGDLPVAGGGRTRRGVLYRSAAPLAHDGAPAAVAWPPALVIDLRSAAERLGGPHPLDSAATRVLEVPLFSAADPARQLRERLAGRWDLTYLLPAMLTRRAEFVVEVVRQIANAAGPCLVHCVAGKDRTGVAVAVVLAAVGVPDEAIVGDFVRTNEHLRALGRRVTAAQPGRGGQSDMSLSLLLAPAEAIDATLRVLHAHPDGAPGWLTGHGLSDADLALLRHRLVETDS